MKQLFTLFLLSLSLQALSIKASIDLFRFSNLDQQYIEVNYRIFAKSLSNGDKAAMEVDEVLSTIMIYQGDKILDFQKNILVGGQGNKDLLDVRRFLVEPGNYQVVIELQNQKGDQKVLKIEKRIEVEPSQTVSMSDIMLLAAVNQSTEKSAMVRNGVYMETLPFGYYDENLNILRSYIEVYGLQNTEKHYCSYEIVRGYDTDPKEVEVVKYKRLDDTELQAHLFKLDISDLMSGNYHYRVTVYNAEKELIVSKVANFKKVNTAADMKQLSMRSDKFDKSFANEIVKDSLDYNLMAMAPIIYEPRRSLLDKLIDQDNDFAKRRLIHDYWKESAGDGAEGAYLAYMNIARAVDKRFFNGTSYGFDTDLGYIFLRYGKPDDAMIVDDELSAFPYQIWRYEKVFATGENNVKFLFYSPTLSHRDFRLLHSTCRVELQNPSWEAELYKKLPEEITGNPSEVRTVNDGISRRAKDLWNDF